MKCAHCLQKNNKEICEQCNKLERCVVCEVFTVPFTEMLKTTQQVQSPLNRYRCLTCEHFEQNIKEECFLCNKSCDKKHSSWSDMVDRYIERGNMCKYCDIEMDRRTPQRLKKPV